MTTRLDGHSEGRNKFPDGFRILQGKQEYITYLDHSSIRIWPSETAAHFDQHTHSAIEIIMPQQGASVYHMLDAVYRVIAFLLFGVMLMCAAFIYLRFWHKEEK